MKSQEGYAQHPLQPTPPAGREAASAARYQVSSIEGSASHTRRGAGADRRQGTRSAARAHTRETGPPAGQAACQGGGPAAAARRGTPPLGASGTRRCESVIVCALSSY